MQCGAAKRQTHKQQLVQQNRTQPDGVMPFQHTHSTTHGLRCTLAQTQNQGREETAPACITKKQAPVVATMPRQFHMHNRMLDQL